MSNDGATSCAEWEGAKSRWHIQSYRRDQSDFAGPKHWPRRPPNIAGFCDSIAEGRAEERRHAFDPPSGIPHPVEREKQWKSSSKRIEPYQAPHDYVTGKKLLVPLQHEENLAWTGSRNNFTGPRHYSPSVTTVQPEIRTTTQSYYLEKIIGTKKAVLSGSMGLQDLFGPNERRCERTALEWSVDSKMQRKIRVPDLEDRRNGIGMANPGDKGYGTSEHAPEYTAMMLAENRRRGNMQRKVMSKIDKSWSQSATDELLDKKGRRMCDYIQIYCRTEYRKNSMYVHRNALIQEISDMAGEGGSLRRRVWYGGVPLPPQATLVECGIRAKATVDLIAEEDVPERRVGWKEKERLRVVSEDVGDVTLLGALDLESKYPPAEREDYEE